MGPDCAIKEAVARQGHLGALVSIGSATQRTDSMGASGRSQAGDDDRGGYERYGGGHKTGESSQPNYKSQEDEGGEWI